MEDWYLLALYNGHVYYQHQSMGWELGLGDEQLGEFRGKWLQWAVDKVMEGMLDEIDGVLVKGEDGIGDVVWVGRVERW